MPDEISRRDIEAVAEAAAEKTIGKVFSLFGIDITDQAQINEHRADLIHGRKMRHMWERGGFRIFMVVLTLAIIGTVSMFWSGFLSTITK